MSSTFIIISFVFLTVACRQANTTNPKPNTPTTQQIVQPTLKQNPLGGTTNVKVSIFMQKVLSIRLTKTSLDEKSTNCPNTNGEQFFSSATTIYFDHGIKSNIINTAQCSVSDSKEATQLAAAQQQELTQLIESIKITTCQQSLSKNTNCTKTPYDWILEVDINANKTIKADSCACAYGYIYDDILPIKTFFSKIPLSEANTRPLSATPPDGTIYE